MVQCSHKVVVNGQELGHRVGLHVAVDGVALLLAALAEVVVFGQQSEIFVVGVPQLLLRAGAGFFLLRLFGLLLGLFLFMLFLMFLFLAAGFFRSAFFSSFLSSAGAVFPFRAPGGSLLRRFLFRGSRFLLVVAHRLFVISLDYQLVVHSGGGVSPPPRRSTDRPPKT
jgi:hypothetical protein